MDNYGLDIWADDNFFIKDGKIAINHKPYPTLLQIVKELRLQGNKGPLLLRFPHITIKQINKLYNTFNKAIKLNNYSGKFYAVFPLKVNQYPNFILPLVQQTKHLNYGLEAGSKAELILAMAYNNLNAPITVNGFKDEEMITLGFIAKASGYNITLTIEGLNELETIIKVYKKLNISPPNIGIRVRLHSSGSGIWAKSGGINSKFGLSSTEILKAIDIIKKENLISYLTMIHFHIGSLMNTIAPLKKAIKEAGHIYTELKQMGANSLVNINIGGGLAIEYSQFKPTIEYSIEEFCNDVVFSLKQISKTKQVDEPNIFIESGRFVGAANSVLITPVLELFSYEFEESDLKLKSKDELRKLELYALYKEMNKTNAREFLHDCLEYLESILTLFDLGYVDLQDRSNAEILTHLIIKKALFFSKDNLYAELKNLQEKIQEKYLLNFSIFQSLPDFWGLNQEFPIVPLTHLDQKPTRSAALWDITCDSDGEIPFNPHKPLYLHDVNLKEEEYFLGFFLVGAYQDILGMRHNLFTSPTEANIEFENNSYKITSLLQSQKILDIFEDLDYDINEIQQKLFEKLKDEKLISILNQYLFDNGYLKTIDLKDET